MYYYPFGRRAKIFVRNADGKYSFGTGDISKPADVVLNTSNKNLFLSRASSMNREIAQKLYRYFMNQFLLGLVNVSDMMILDGFNTYKDVILKALEVCDTDITDIEVRKEQIPAPVMVPGQGDVSFKLVDVLKSDGSQLLFSSHNTNLIDVKRLRRDQIVFVNKSEYGATEVYSLYDFKDFRENMDAEKGYIRGRFDAVPYVDSSVDSIKQLLEG